MFKSLNVYLFIYFKDKLALEADGIFMWALEGLKRLVKNHYAFSESERSNEELRKYRTECNSILSFITNNCSLEEDKQVELKEMYREYMQYCEESGLSPVSQKRFGKEFLENYPEISTTKDTVSRRLVYISYNFKIHRARLILQAFGINLLIFGIEFKEQLVFRRFLWIKNLSMQ